jgi:hypothetical protein
MPAFPRRLASTLLAILAACSTCACATTQPQPAGPATSLSVRELNIVDEHGQARVRIGAPLPDPKGLKRAVTIYGIQFMDSAGREIGGLAMLDKIGIQGLCFDTLEGVSAMCVGLIKGQPQVSLADKGGHRILLGVNDGVATIELNDASGKPQLRLEVDKEGKARVDGVNPAPPNKSK